MTKPMSIPQAVEVIKILSPYATEFTETMDSVKVMRVILENILKDMPTQSLRLIALMERLSIEQVAEEMADQSGIDLIRRISEGFEKNNLPLLMDAAYTWQMSEARWEVDDGGQ